MVIKRRNIHWAELGQPEDSTPAKRRPVIVISADVLNTSTIKTVTVVTLTSNETLALLPGNSYLPKSATGLPKNSVANVTQIVTLDKNRLGQQVGEVPAQLMTEIDAGLRTALSLG